MVLLAMVLVLVALLAARLNHAGAAEPPTAMKSSIPGLSPEEVAILRERALHTAADMGESHPTDGIIVSTTQHTFFAAQQGPTFGTPDFDVYVMAFRGDFTAYGASRPAGADPPQGHAVYAVYNAQTLEVTDWGIGEDLPTFLERWPSMALDLDS